VAIFNDPASLGQLSEAAVSLRPNAAAYPVWQAHLVRAVALADQIRTAPGRTAERAELDEIIDWMAQRAADMPENFRHMVSLVEAERAWAVGEFRQAMYGFDSAIREAQNRPWHRAYIAERLARFMMAQGLDHTWRLMADCLARWSPADMQQTFPDEWDDGTPVKLSRVPIRASRFRPSPPRATPPGGQVSPQAPSTCWPSSPPRGH